LSNNIIDMIDVEVATPDTESSAPAEDAAATDTEPTDTSPDMFPRGVVEGLRKESAAYRERAKVAEGRVSALQRSAVAQQVTNAGMRPAAVWAVAELDDLLSDDGTVDTEKVKQAMATARESLGAAGGPRRRKEVGELFSGAGPGRQDYTPGPGFASAFGPRSR
jgi:hypothetical protein